MTNAAASIRPDESRPPVRQMIQVGRAPAAGRVPTRACVVAGNATIGVISQRDVAAIAAKLAQPTDRIEPWIEEAERESGLLIQVGDDAGPLRRAFAGTAEQVVARIRWAKKAQINEDGRVVVVGVIGHIRNAAMAAQLPLHVGLQ